MKTMRRGVGKGLGCGYKNLMPKDAYIHGLSAKGIKQHFMYHNPKGSFYGQDIYADDMKQAKEIVRQEMGVKRLPNNVAIWKKLNAESFNKTYNENSAVESAMRGRRILFQSKEHRDRVFKLLKQKGIQASKGVSKGQQIHPEYIEDYEGTVETGFGNTMYQTYFPTLYRLEVKH